MTFYGMQSLDDHNPDPDLASIGIISNYFNLSGTMFGLNKAEQALLREYDVIGAGVK